MFSVVWLPAVTGSQSTVAVIGPLIASPTETPVAFSVEPLWIVIVPVTPKPESVPGAAGRGDPPVQRARVADELVRSTFAS